MTEIRLIQTFFERENEKIDENYYDPTRNETDNENNIRIRFNMYRKDPYGNRSKDKAADGAGHYKSCPYYVLEVKTSDIDKALEQLETTISYIIKANETVKKVAIIVDTMKWNTKLRDFYRINEEKQLFVRDHEEYQVFIKLNINDRKFNFPVFLYTENFKYYNLP